VRNTEHLADCRNPGLAIAGGAGPFRQVEHKIRRIFEQLFEKGAPVAEFDWRVPHLADRLGDRLDRRGAVEFLVEIIGGAGRKRDLGFQIKSDPDAHPSGSENATCGVANERYAASGSRCWYSSHRTRARFR